MDRVANPICVSPARLVCGLFVLQSTLHAVYVKIVEWRGDEVMSVPLSGLLRWGQSWALVVVGGGTAQLRTIQVGRKTGFHAQITEDLAKRRLRRPASK